MEKFGSGINIPDPQHCLNFYALGIWSYLKVKDDSVKLWRGLFKDGRQLLVGEAGQIPLHGLLNNLHSLSNLSIYHNC
jgi:hypothetical protein